jgi:hypothetical protein
MIPIGLRPVRLRNGHWVCQVEEVGKMNAEKEKDVLVSDPCSEYFKAKVIEMSHIVYQTEKDQEVGAVVGLEPCLFRHRSSGGWLV